jgi:hypothetical protein
MRNLPARQWLPDRLSEQQCPQCLNQYVLPWLATDASALRHTEETSVYAARSRSSTPSDPHRQVLKIWCPCSSASDSPHDDRDASASHHRVSSRTDGILPQHAKPCNSPFEVYVRAPLGIGGRLRYPSGRCHLRHHEGAGISPPVIALSPSPGASVLSPKHCIDMATPRWAPKWSFKLRLPTDL